MSNTLRIILLLAVFIQCVLSGITRIHYIAAEEVIWNYGPTGINGATGLPLSEDPDASRFFSESDDRVGGTYKKAIYVEYTDATYTVVKPREEYLGFIGPVLRAEVGDTIQVKFKNNLPAFNITMHVHGVLPGAAPAVVPGGNYTWNWAVPARSGPGVRDFSSVIYPYHSNIRGTKDINAGLVGAVIVTGKGMALSDGRPADVDREYILWYEIFDESSSSYFAENIATYMPTHVNNTALLASTAFKKSQLRACINGFSFGNMVDLNMTVGERVRWYSIGLGGERDVHTVHWDGITGINPQNVRLDSEIVIPVKSAIVDIIPDRAGRHMVECHVNDHFHNGMFSYFVTETANAPLELKSYATTYDLWANVSLRGPFYDESSSAWNVNICIVALLVCLLLVF